MQVVAIVICGGSGSRLWPLSRLSFPKPFVILPGQVEPLILQTYRRLASDSMPHFEAVITVTAKDYSFLCRDYYRTSGLASKHIVINEPIGRNTAPAIAVASEVARRQFGDDVVLAILPADHLIPETEMFACCFQTALSATTENKIAVIGIPPTTPATGYGYIESKNRSAVSAIHRFIEKPNLEKAQQYQKSEKFLWNAGMFFFSAKTGLDEISANEKNISTHLETLLPPDLSEDIHFNIEDYLKFPNISFDYAVMEHTQRAVVVPGHHFTWSDVGNWNSIAETLPADENENRLVGEVELNDSHNCFIVSSNRLIAGSGLQNICIIDTPDALFVGNQTHANAVQDHFNHLRENKHPSVLASHTVLRPWGSFTVLSAAEKHKVKRIEVKPQSQLSLQSHEHRSEHWTCVAGVMTIVIDERQFELTVNESCYIPQGAKHRMINATDTIAVIIEVQIGDYLEEDDITRYEDIYGRT